MAVSREGPALKCGWRKDQRETWHVYKQHDLDANIFKLPVWKIRIKF